MVLSISSPAAGFDLSALAELFSMGDLSSLAGSASSGSSSSASSDSTLSGILELISSLTQTEIKECTVAPVPDQKYTGKEVKPSVTVTDGDKKLKRGTDYTLTYSDNVKVGTARIIIKGKGDYTGTKRVSFKIVRNTSSGSASSSGKKTSSSSGKTSSGSSSKTKSEA